jgi:Do/DeqQ family serine protease
VVEKSLPAVVYIDVRKKVGGGAASQDPQDEMFRRFFGPDIPEHRQRVPSSGSGFIVDGAGHILTNNHVVRDASDITVTLNDKRTFKAKVVGSDPETDVAVIKIEGENLPVMPLGDSDKIQVGDWAIAMGNPLGMLRGSVTVGIISARGRSSLNIFGGTPAFQDFIQTDASINFGNSGGPLCNIRGEAIGINTAINTSGQGIGFAIPINLAKHVADQLMASGKVQRAWLGVQLAELTPELAEGFGMKNHDGILVQEVLPGTPAERAGLKRNDIIVEFNGQPVVDVPKFRLRVADTRVGANVPVTILRGSKRMTVSVTLSERNSEALAQAQPGTRTPEPQGVAGLRVRNLTDEERSSSGSESGVVVTDVEGGSAADEAGLRPGDIIEQIGGEPVADAGEFARTVKSLQGSRKHAALLVQRNGQSRFVALRIAD